MPDPPSSHIFPEPKLASNNRDRASPQGGPVMNADLAAEKYFCFDAMSFLYVSPSTLHLHENQMRRRRVNNPNDASAAKPIVVGSGTSAPVGAAGAGKTEPKFFASATKSSEFTAPS